MTNPTCLAHKAFLENDNANMFDVAEEVSITAGTDEQGNTRIDVQYEDGSKLIFVFAPSKDDDSAKVSWEPPPSPAS